MTISTYAPTLVDYHFYGTLVDYHFWCQSTSWFPRLNFQTKISKRSQCAPVQLGLKLSNLFRKNVKKKVIFWKKVIKPSWLKFRHYEKATIFGDLQVCLHLNFCIHLNFCLHFCNEFLPIQLYTKIHYKLSHKVDEISCIIRNCMSPKIWKNLPPVLTKQRKNKWEIFSNFCDLFRKARLYANFYC